MKLDILTLLKGLNNEELYQLKRDVDKEILYRESEQGTIQTVLLTEADLPARLLTSLRMAGIKA